MNTLPKLSVPTYTLTIPSTDESVSYRPYLMREEKVLMIALEAEDSKQIEAAIIDVVSNCIEYSGNVKNLTSYDVEYIFLQLRSVSVGESLEIIKICTECEAQNTVNINIKNVVIKNNNVVSNKNLIKLSPDLTLELHQTAIGDKMHFEDTDTNTDVLITSAANALSIIYHGDDIIDAKVVALEERQEFIEGLSSNQFQLVIDYLLDTPYVYYEDKFTCTKCGNVDNFNYTGLIDFFI